MTVGRSGIDIFGIRIMYLSASCEVFYELRYRVFGDDDRVFLLRFSPLVSSSQLFESRISNLDFRVGRITDFLSNILMSAD